MNTPGFKESIDTAAAALKVCSAFTEGQRAGYLHNARTLNPFVAGTAEHSEWERGRSATRHLEAA